MSAAEASTRVTAVVVTFNRRDLLVECLRALERQTHPLDRVVLVDNASTDGTEEHVVASGLAERLPVDVVRLRRNGGGAEGFHHGMREALAGDPHWIWLMDDDCEPADDALERLLASPKAEERATGGLAGRVQLPSGQPLPLHRARVIRRWLRLPIQGLDEDERAREETPCDFASFAGPLFRAAVVRELGLPEREMFIRYDDLEYSARLRSRGYTLWHVGASVLTHKEPGLVTGSTAGAAMSAWRTRIPFKDGWKTIYGLRNVIHAGRRHGFVSAPAAASYVAVFVARTNLFDERPLRSALVHVALAVDGWRGRFRNVPPRRWAALATTRRPLRLLDRDALRYDEDVAEPPRRLPAPDGVKQHQLRRRRV